jgi:hypothetical protein
MSCTDPKLIALWDYNESFKNNFITSILRKKAYAKQIRVVINDVAGDAPWTKDIRPTVALCLNERSSKYPNAPINGQIGIDVSRAPYIGGYIRLGLIPEDSMLYYYIEDQHGFPAGVDANKALLATNYAEFCSLILFSLDYTTALYSNTVGARVLVDFSAQWNNWVYFSISWGTCTENYGIKLARLYGDVFQVTDYTYQGNCEHSDPIEIGDQVRVILLGAGSGNNRTHMSVRIDYINGGNLAFAWIKITEGNAIYYIPSYTLRSLTNTGDIGGLPTVNAPLPLYSLEHVAYPLQKTFLFFQMQSSKYMIALRDMQLIDGPSPTTNYNYHLVPTKIPSLAEKAEFDYFVDLVYNNPVSNDVIEVFKRMGAHTMFLDLVGNGMDWNNTKKNTDQVLMYNHFYLQGTGGTFGDPSSFLPFQYWMGNGAQAFSSTKTARFNELFTANPNIFKGTWYEYVDDYNNNLTTLTGSGMQFNWDEVSKLKPCEQMELLSLSIDFKIVDTEDFWEWWEQGGWLQLIGVVALVVSVATLNLQNIPFVLAVMILTEVLTTAIDASSLSLTDKARLKGILAISKTVGFFMLTGQFDSSAFVSLGIQIAGNIVTTVTSVGMAKLVDSYNSDLAQTQALRDEVKKLFEEGEGLNNGADIKLQIENEFIYDSYDIYSYGRLSPYGRSEKLYEPYNPMYGPALKFFNIDLEV